MPLGWEQQDRDGGAWSLYTPTPFSPSISQGRCSHPPSPPKNSLCLVKVQVTNPAISAGVGGGEGISRPSSSFHCCGTSSLGDVMRRVGGREGHAGCCPLNSLKPLNTSQTRTMWVCENGAMNRQGRRRDVAIMAVCCGTR